MREKRRQRSGRRNRRKPVGHAQLTGSATSDHESTPYEQALEARDFQKFRSTDVNSLIEQAAAEMKARGIVDEIGTLRIVLARLITEENDLQILTSHVTQIVKVALEAAKTRRLIDGDLIAEKGSALGKIVVEVEKARVAENIERIRHDNSN